MLYINGSFGEGGGQILRSALALSMVTGAGVRIEKIRAGRVKPGLLRQHLTALNAATEIAGADVTGAEIGSREITFKPRAVKAGEYNFAVGTAGSTSLVLQTILPALILADAPSVVTLTGGTHNPFAPPFDFLERAFLPLLARMGAQVDATLVRHGFYPAGGGAAVYHITPAPDGKLQPLDLTTRGAIKSVCANALISNLPHDIARRELAVVGKKLGWTEDCLNVIELKDRASAPGNVVMLEVAAENVTEVFTSFGEKGVTAERVANLAARQAQEYLESEAAAGEYLADQLLLPLALAGGGAFTAHTISSHMQT